MIEKLNMMSGNIIKSNIDYILERFPNIAVESVDKNGDVIKTIDFDLLKQELSYTSLDEKNQRYHLTWPGKKQSILLANSAINGTLRPIKEKSKLFESTKNLYIEGDNLDVLKLIRETYLGKIKMIYIDPPYNTKKDFIYKDNFTKSSEDYLEESGQYDEQGNRMFANTESSGRLHTNWLNMIYPRLKVAKDLLTDDGVIFISIDEHEIGNMIKVCDEIFYEKNFVGNLVRKTKTMTGDDSSGLNVQHEFILIYSKNIEKVNLVGNLKSFAAYKNPDNDPNGDWCPGDPSAKSGSESTYFGITNPYTKQVDYPPKGRYWAFNKSTMQKYILSGRIMFKKEVKNNERGFIFKRYKEQLESVYDPFDSLTFIDNKYLNSVATTEMKKIFDEQVFSYPKPVEFIYKLLKSINDPNMIVMDFFSGSGTTAEAVLKLNSEDNGDRRFIMVQLPENLDDNLKSAKEKSTKQLIENAIKLCDEINCEHYLTNVAEERIRRISKVYNKCRDCGFRVLKLDSSNMNDVYYNPNNINQTLLDETVDNVKADRTALDLLFQIMLELGIDLSSNIEEKKIDNKKVYFVNDNDIIACFDDTLNDNLIKQIAKYSPIYAVFRDSSFINDSSNINCEQIFKIVSSSTILKVI